MELLLLKQTSVSGAPAINEESSTAWSIEDKKPTSLLFLALIDKSLMVSASSEFSGNRAKI